MDLAFFNVDDGFLEAVLRGFKKGILRKADYANLEQCDVLEDMKMHLSGTDYGDFLQNEPSPLHTVTVAEKCTQKLVSEFEYLRSQAVAPLTKFLDYITYGYMIDNIVLLITGTLHDRKLDELVDKCHPLGLFEEMKTLVSCTSMKELYNHVLIDTPLAPYFRVMEDDIDETNIEIIRNTLYKAYLKDFYDYCKKMGGITGEVMSGILEFEADRRAINITINSFGTELTKDERDKLYPEFGLLYPEGTWKLGKCDNTNQVRTVVEAYTAYANLFSDTGFDSDKSLVDAFYEYEVKVNQLAFDQMQHYGIFYAYFKLREQEIRNIVWIAECISQKMHDKINHYVPIFEDY